MCIDRDCEDFFIFLFDGTKCKYTQLNLIFILLLYALPVKFYQKKNNSFNVPTKEQDRESFRIAGKSLTTTGGKVRLVWLQFMSELL